MALSGAAILAAAAVVGALSGLPILVLAFGAFALYAVGLLTGIVPPGRPPERGERSASQASHETEPIWPYVVPSAQPAYTERLRYAQEEEANDTSWAAWTLATIILAAGIGGTAVLVVALGGGSGGSAADPEETEAVAGVNAVASPSPAPPTETPVPPSPTPTPTAPAPSPTPTTAASPAPSATATRVPARGDAASLSGRWLIVDVVAFGPDAGKTFSFAVTLTHDGDRITGTGDGLSLQGSLKDQVLTLTFQRPGGEGVFVWSMLNKDLLIGDFRDHTASNGGPSTLTRIS